MASVLGPASSAGDEAARAAASGAALNLLQEAVQAGGTRVTVVNDEREDGLPSGLRKARALLWSALLSAATPLLMDLRLRRGDSLVPPTSRAFSST